MMDTVKLPLLRLGVCAVLVLSFSPAISHAAESLVYSVSPNASMITREAVGKPWVNVNLKRPVPFDHLVIALPDAAIVNSTGSVKLISRADLEGLSPFPILETAFVVKPAPEGVDLAVTFDRGRIELVNTRDKGAATVKVQFLDQTWTIRLLEPGTRMTLEMYGRHLSGSVYRPKLDTAPIVSVLALMIDKTAEINTGSEQVEMSEAPGYALMEWNNESNAVDGPTRLMSLPDWANPDHQGTERTKLLQARIDTFRKLRLKVSPDEAPVKLYETFDPINERLALIMMAAQDDLMGLAKEISATHDIESWDMGMIVLRHWLGRAKGNDHLLYEFLTTKRPYKAIQARIIMQLILGFGRRELETPELYELLIEYLKNDAPAIRNMAAWHLYRLVPAMRMKVPYVPNGTPEQFAELYKAWKAAIPAGQVPHLIDTDKIRAVPFEPKK